MYFSLITSQNQYGIDKLQEIELANYYNEPISSILLSQEIIHSIWTPFGVTKLHACFIRVKMFLPMHVNLLPRAGVQTS